jgi:mRNA-degrading endonuclease RelE of RelBE toxin-antitoxin system
MVKLEWKKQARSAFNKLDISIQQRITDKLQEIAENADRYPHRPLRGSLAGNFRFRVGIYRVMYTYKNDLLIVQKVQRRDENYG